MKKMWIVILIVVGVIALVITAVAGVCLYLYLHRDDQIMDGPGLINEDSTGSLYGKWVEINPYGEASTLRIEKDKIKYSYYSTTEEFGYTVPEEIVPEKLVGREIRITTDGELGDMLYEAIEIDGRAIGVLSTLMFEMDGRGEIISSQFVKETEISNLPEGFVSPAYESKNKKDGPATSVEILYADNLEMAANWVGVSQTQLDVSDSYYKYDGSFASGEVVLDVFGYHCQGDIYLQKLNGEYVTTAITATVDGIEFEELSECMRAEYGEPKNSGLEPYAKDNGGEVTWQTYEIGEIVVRISIASEEDSIRLKMAAE